MTRKPLQHDNYTRRLALNFDTKSPAIQEDRIHRAASYFNLIGGHGDPLGNDDRNAVLQLLQGGDDAAALEAGTKFLTAAEWWKHDWTQN